MLSTSLFCLRNCNKEHSNGGTIPKMKAKYLHNSATFWIHIGMTSIDSLCSMTINHIQISTHIIWSDCVGFLNFTLALFQSTVTNMIVFTFIFQDEKDEGEFNDSSVGYGISRSFDSTYMLMSVVWILVLSCMLISLPNPFEVWGIKLTL